MKKILKKLLRTVAMIMCASMLFGAIPAAAYTLPGPDANLNKHLAVAGKVKYVLSPSKGYDQFGKNQQVGSRENYYYNFWHHIYAFDFKAGSSDLELYTPKTGNTTKGYSLGDDLYFWHESDSTKDPNMKASDAFGMRSHDKNAVFSFVGPMDGTFKLTMKLQRAAAGSSKINVIQGGKVIKTLTVTEKLLTVNETVTLKEFEKLSFELVDNTGTAVYARTVEAVITALRTGELEKEYDNGNNKPLFSVALISDTHIDGTNAVKEDPLQTNHKNMIQYLQNYGKVDAIILPGDVISESVYHTNNKEKAGWTYDNTIRTINILDEALASATKTGKNVFYVSGNHDTQAGVIAEYKDPTKRLNTADYSPWMVNRSGNFLAALYTKDIYGGADKVRYPEEVLCYLYEVGGMYFIGINQPYTTAVNGKALNASAIQSIFPQQILWVREQLEKIGKNMTVNVFMHYNQHEGRTPSWTYNCPSQYASLGHPAELLLETLEQYPNANYIYGHNHYLTEVSIAWYNSSELIWSYGGRTQNADGSWNTNGYQYIQSGLTRLSKISIDMSSPAGDSTKAAQFTIVEYYKDHITYRVIDAGAQYLGAKEATSFTIKRDMSQLDVYGGKGHTYVAEEDPDAPVISLPQTDEVPPVTGKPNAPDSNNTNAWELLDYVDSFEGISNGPFTFGGMNATSGAPLASTFEAATGTHFKINSEVYDANGNAVQYDMIVNDKDGLWTRANTIYYDKDGNPIRVGGLTIFTAPADGEYNFSAQFTKFYGKNSQGDITEMFYARKAGETKDITFVVSTFGISNELITLDGVVDLKKGEKIYFGEYPSDSAVGRGAYGAYINSINVWATSESEDTGNTTENPGTTNPDVTNKPNTTDKPGTDAPEKGNEKSNKGLKPVTIAVIVIAAVAVVAAAAVVTVVFLKKKK